MASLVHFTDTQVIRPYFPTRAEYNLTLHEFRNDYDHTLIHTAKRIKTNASGYNNKDRRALLINKATLDLAK